MTNAPELLAVEQCDRDAVREYCLKHVPNGMQNNPNLDGLWLNGLLEAFARHRIETRPAMPDVAGLVSRLRDGCIDKDDGEYIRILRKETDALLDEAADALEALSPRAGDESDRWVTVAADAAHYADHGRHVILCDRLPHPVTLVLKNPVLRDGFLPLAGNEGLPSSLADRVGTSAASDEQVEAVARAICLSQGQEPDDLAPISIFCGPNNEPCPQWMRFEEEARAAIAALTLSPSRDDVLEEAAKVADDMKVKSMGGFRNLWCENIADAIRATKGPRL